MPHISKRELSKQEFKELYSQFVRSLHKLDSFGATNIFLNQFLTPTEKVMLSKRLAIILLLDKGISPYEIWNKLGVSSSTVMRLALKIDRGGYKRAISSIKKNNSSLEELINWFIYAGGLMPPRVGSRKKWREYRKKQLGF